MWCMFLQKHSSSLSLMSSHKTSIFTSLLQLTLCPPSFSPFLFNNDQSFLSFAFLPPPSFPVWLPYSTYCLISSLQRPQLKPAHAHTHTHTHLVKEIQSPPLLHDGLGLAPTVTACDCNLRLTWWGYMAFPGYLHNAQGERWRKPSEKKRGGWGGSEERKREARWKDIAGNRVGLDRQQCLLNIWVKCSYWKSGEGWQQTFYDGV